LVAVLIALVFMCSGNSEPMGAGVEEVGVEEVEATGEESAEGADDKPAIEEVEDQEEADDEAEEGEEKDGEGESKASSGLRNRKKKAPRAD